MSENDRDNKAEELQSKITKDRRRAILRIFVLVLILAFLVFLYDALTQFGSPFFISILILLFVFLVFLGLLLRKNRGSIYKRLFPDKREAIQKKRARKEHKMLLKRPSTPQHEKIGNIDLNVKYKKPVVKRCPSCNIVVPNFAKKCPFCGEIIM